MLLPYTRVNQHSSNFFLGDIPEQDVNRHYIVTIELCHKLASKSKINYEISYE
jgi:hypothetical protein